MEVLELKTKLHGLIDEINNYAFLENFYRLVEHYRGADAGVDIVDELTDQQRARLNDSILQARNGKTIPHETARKQIDQWLTK